jgi:hypothetical protein
MVSHVHVALTLRLKFKLWEILRSYFQVDGLRSIFGSGKYKIVSRKKKEFKNLKILLVSFELYFIIS